MEINGESLLQNLCHFEEAGQVVSSILSLATEQEEKV
jgi:hypothetical protein